MASITRVVRCLLGSRHQLHRSRFLYPLALDSQTAPCRCSSSVWEPDFNVTPEIPEYPILQLRLRGYDFVTLESYHRYVQKLISILKVELVDSFPVPARTTEVQTLKRGSSQVENTYKIAQYERTLQIEGLNSKTAPILLETMQLNLPQGTWFTVKEPEEEESDFRYVPDLVLEDLKSKISDLDRAKEDRRR